MRTVFVVVLATLAMACGNSKDGVPSDDEPEQKPATPAALYSDVDSAAPPAPPPPAVVDAGVDAADAAVEKAPTQCEVLMGCCQQEKSCSEEHYACKAVAEQAVEGSCTSVLIGYKQIGGCEHDKNIEPSFLPGFQGCPGGLFGWLGF